ncbi:MAG: DUF559 domain-containing protein [Solirubrobacteraceae bacterium]|nr:DUF559 domain-containing protein [Solirubrobacteraceae bacterium]
MFASLRRMRRRRRTWRDEQRIIEALKREAAPQAGVLHRKQFLAQGLSSDEVRSWAASGRIQPRFRWTYVFPGTGLTLATRAWSAQLSSGGDTAVTSSQALALLDVIKELPGAFEATRSDGQTRRQSGLIVHRTDCLPDEDVTRVGGVRTARFPRAILDLAARGDVDLVSRALDSGARLRLFDGRAFERLQRQHARAAGLAVLDEALTRLDENTGRKRSELERRLIKLILESGMPTPLVNTMVGPDEVDILFPGTRAIIEADGREHHSSPADIAADIEKQRRLEALGFVVKRFDWNAVVYEPERTIERAEAFRLANLEPPIPQLILPASLDGFRRTARHGSP